MQPRILVVEDDVSNRRVLSRFLRDVGEVDAVGDGEDALARFGRAHAKGSPYFLIILDLMLPRLEGLEFLAEVRRQEQGMGIPPGEQVKVLIVTCLDDREKKCRARQARVEGYLVKPVDRGMLDQHLTALGLPLPQS